MVKPSRHPSYEALHFDTSSIRRRTLPGKLTAAHYPFVVGMQMRRSMKSVPLRP